jgi:hypothetical protein
MEQQVIRCSKCGEKKPNTDFRRYGIAKMKLRSECRECESIQGRFKRDAHKVAGINPGKCSCCKKVTDDLVVDHCHNSGNFRGWLCRNCNTGIGKLGDTVDSLVTALNYLLRIETYDNGYGMFEVSVAYATSEENQKAAKDIVDALCNDIFNQYFINGDGI